MFGPAAAISFEHSSSRRASLHLPTHAIIGKSSGVAVTVFCANGTVAARDAVVPLDAAAHPLVLPPRSAAAEGVKRGQQKGADVSKAVGLSAFAPHRQLGTGRRDLGERK